MAFLSLIRCFWINSDTSAHCRRIPHRRFPAGNEPRSSSTVMYTRRTCGAKEFPRAEVDGNNKSINPHHEALPFLLKIGTGTAVETPKWSSEHLRPSTRPPVISRSHPTPSDNWLERKKEIVESGPVFPKRSRS